MQRKTIDMNIVDGFEFETAKEAEQAQKELSGIRYIKQNTDMKNPDVVYMDSSVFTVIRPQEDGHH